MKNYRIFLSLVEVAGYYSSLKIGLNQIGVQAETGFITNHRFRYDHQSNRIQKMTAWAHSRYLSYSSKNEWKKYIMIPIILFIFTLLYSIFAIQSFYKYNIFIFGFRRSFLPYNLDIPILKLFKKKVVFIFHGSDSRDPFYNGVYSDSDLGKLQKIRKRQKFSISIIDKYADHIITQPAISQCHNRKVINWIKIGMPFYMSERTSENVEMNNHNSSVFPIILHSPSKPHAKGTNIIRNAIKDLQEQGYKFIYTEINNQSHDYVLKELEKCSFVIDQLYSDLHLAGFATEAAFHSKPAIVGGYELDKLKLIVGPTYTAPTIKIQPDINQLKEKIVFLLQNEPITKKLGLQAHNFVKQHYEPSIVAEKIIRVIANDIPTDWYIDLKGTTFNNGCAISKERLDRRLHELKIYQS